MTLGTCGASSPRRSPPPGSVLIPLRRQQLPAIGHPSDPDTPARAGIALALADSSVVTLALPDILRRFDLEISEVAWVLTSFNLGLALAAVPAAYLARRRPALAFGVGTVVFAAASLACGLAPSFAVLLAGRGVQSVGGALLVCASLALLSELEHSDAKAVHVWAAAGIAGAALGPAAGGILTETLGWESIFLVQAPLAVITLAALRGFAQRLSPHLPVGRRFPRTSRCCSCPVRSPQRSSCSCCCSSTAGGCRRSPPLSS